MTKPTTMATCNQCFKEMKYQTIPITKIISQDSLVTIVANTGELKLPYCENPECANYALYQKPHEEFTKDYK